MPWGVVAMGWGRGKGAEKWPLSQGSRTWLQTGKACRLKSQIKPGDFFFSKPPPTSFLIEKIMYAHSKKKKFFFSKSTKGYTMKNKSPFLSQTSSPSYLSSEASYC